MRRSATLALTVGILFSALPAVVPSVMARNAAGAEHARIVAHWTPERLRSAVPRDYVLDPARGFVPKKPPAGGGKPPPSGGSSVAGASWTKGGAILKASGKVYFEMGQYAYVCSGSVAHDTRSGYSLVLTAGHCVYDQDNPSFATNWLFIPQFDTAPTFTCGSTAFGCWTATALVVNNGFASAGGFNTQATVNDFAFAVVGPGGKSGTAQLDATVGDFGLAYSGTSAGNSLYAFGYPAAGKYKGKDLTYCAGPIGQDSLNSNLTWSMGCDMTGGSSGGPWLRDFSETTGSGTLNSLNSYGYSGVKSMFGPKFNSSTQAVFNAANGATSNTIVN